MIQSSPTNMSAQVAWGDVALSAGCISSIARIVVNPPYEMPNTPTRPLLSGTFLMRKAMVSYVSVDSSVELRWFLSRGGRRV